jgi:ABC-2 type transport system ATP-binding protein
MTLEIVNINKSYGANHVLKDVSFTATSEKTMGLLGRNGHGKTTAIKVIMGIIYADNGDVLLDGAPINRNDVKLGYLPEERGLYQNVKVLEQMVYFAKLRGMRGKQAKKSALELLEKLEMTEYIKSEAITLSKGNQQKIQLAVTLLNDPDILILDEPFSGLDPVNSRLLQELIEENARKNKLIIFSSHQLASVEEFCQDICIMNHGEIVLAGHLREIKDSYPKDKIRILPTTGTENILREALISLEPQGFKFEEKTDESFLVYLNNEADKNQLYSQLTSRDADIHTFAVQSPTLLEIFLEKAGDEDVA